MKGKEVIQAVLSSEPIQYQYMSFHEARTNSLFTRTGWTKQQKAQELKKARLQGAVL